MRKKELEKLAKNQEAAERFQNCFRCHSTDIKNKETNKRDLAEQPLHFHMPNFMYDKRIRETEDFKNKFKTNNLDKKFLYFSKHIICKYKTPKFFDKLLNTTDVKIEKNKEYLEWFICLGTGGSFYKTFMKEHLTKKETHILANCQDETFNVSQAIVYAIALAECNNIGISKRLALSRLSEKSYKREFWKNCVKFFANEERVPETVGKINDLVDYLGHEVGQNQDFNIFGSGFTLYSLNKRMISWHHELRRIKEFGNFSWDGHDIQNFFHVKNENQYNEERFHIKQIKTSKELLEEGKEQHHCVFSYKPHCISGRCSIWSLSLNEKKKVTIEVVNNNIVQARGFANRSTKSEEDFIINKWCSLTGVNYNIRY
jgi:hypothetical protein